MSSRFRRLRDTCQPYLVTSTFGSLRDITSLPRGLELRPELRFDPTRTRSGRFLSALQRLDTLTFGPVGMIMPRWVFYDCAEIPGAIFGFARPAREMPGWVLDVLEIDADYDGPVPVSMFVVIPMLEPGCWHTYTLCSLNQVAPGAAPANVAAFTLAVALEAFGIETIYGTAQWRSPALGVHARFCPLDLVTAWTPAHSEARTLTYRFPVARAELNRALDTDERIRHHEPDDASLRWIDCDEPDQMRALQADLEQGRRFEIVAQPSIRGADTRVPVREVSP